jgi:hypothetical protein
MEYKVGQKLWFERTLNAKPGTGEDVIVTKVGRKWVDLAKASYPTHKGYRVAVDSVNVDGGNYSSPGRVWASEEEAQDNLERVAEWNRLRDDVYRLYSCPPKGMTKDDITKLREAIKKDA